MKKLLFAVLLTVAAFSACKKEDPPAPPASTDLVITILDINGNPSAGAFVQLYKTQGDLDNDRNGVGEKSANSSGKVTYTGLQPIVYYFRAASADQSKTDEGSISTALDEGATNTLTIVVK